MCPHTRYNSFGVVSCVRGELRGCRRVCTRSPTVGMLLSDALLGAPRRMIDPRRFLDGGWDRRHAERLDLDQDGGTLRATPQLLASDCKSWRLIPLNYPNSDSEFAGGE